MDETTRSFYPDLADYGGLARALQAAFTRIGSAIRVEDFRSTVCVMVRSARRESQVFIAAKERLFLLDFWNRGVMLARGKTPDLDLAARAMDRWIGSSCGTGDLAAAFDFVEPTKSARSYEQGVEVEERWREYLETMSERIPELEPVVSAASARPELRRLFPYTSLNSLCFSRCTGYPFTRDVASIVPTGDGTYRVQGKSRRDDLGGGDAEEAVDVVVKHLPPGCGPAVAGTADELEDAPHKRK